MDNDDLLIKFAEELKILSKNLNLIRSSNTVKDVGIGESNILIPKDPYSNLIPDNIMKLEITNNTPKEFKVTVLKQRERSNMNDNK